MATMEPRALIKITVAAGLVAALGAIGCRAGEEEEASATPDRVTAGGSSAAVLKSTVFLSTGCTAAKVGPKHLLLAARCVVGNIDVAPGKRLEIVPASAGVNTLAPAQSDAGGATADAGPPRDAGRDATATTSDGGTKPAAPAAEEEADAPANPSARTAKIAAVTVHPSFTAKCKDDACAFGKIEASDAPDIAVITLEEDLATVPTVPVDLDAVGQADPLLVVSSGCADLGARLGSGPKAVKTIAVPAKSVNHAGSPYASSPQLVTRLAASYVVTPGAAWRSTEPRLCQSDIGAPVFRAGSAAVAGVTSNFTTYANGKLVPVTTHHTRVDDASRFKIGEWLTDLGVETVHSCSETAGGCAKRVYEGGAPMPPPSAEPGTTEPGDGGAGDAGPIDPDAGEATTPEDRSSPYGETLPTEEPEAEYGDEEIDYSDAAAPKKKKKAEASGCSAAPSTLPGGELALGAAVAFAAALVRRRRAR